MSEFVDVLSADDVPNGTTKAVTVAGKSVLICHSAGVLYAVGNMCTHAAAPLEGGKCRGHYIFCPLHGARFDLRDGSTAGALTKEPIPVYEVKAEAGRIWVRPA
jgi:3-phenylpropionate/trans-cinnamate dioxygenase ferredoxin subunit